MYFTIFKHTNLKNQIIPFWNYVSKRAAMIRLAKWNTTVHAPIRTNIVSCSYIKIA